MLRIQAKKW